VSRFVHVLTIGVRPKRLQRFYRRHYKTFGVLWLADLAFLVGTPQLVKRMAR
jgi:hypothetical protein